jgi:hypothetical protein
MLNGEQKDKRSVATKMTREQNVGKNTITKLKLS